jgi:Rad3-related DNA helicase
MEFIKIPSTFDPGRRPIYVVDNRNFTNFSEKVESGRGYVYKTEAGIRKFTLELASVSKRISRYIKDKYDKNTNIIIHCHTFDIAKKIAEYCPDVDGGYLVHLPEGSNKIRNLVTGCEVDPKDKNELIQIMKDNPNRGLTIVSPSISEGVDFKHDIARAQIVLKRPIPYLGDIYVKSYYKGNADVGLERDPDFLDRICFTIMTQQYGRVMRSADDWGYTVIMDQSITLALKELIRNTGRVDDLNLKYFYDGLKFSRNKQGTFSFDWIFG